MKKGTRTWKLWYMMFIYILAMIGVTGIYAEYVISRELNGFIQLLSTIVLVFIVGVFLSKTVNLLSRILKRKELW